MIEVYKLMTG